MLEYRDLDIYCDDTRFEEFAHLVIDKLDNGWFHDVDEEKRLRPVLSSKFVFCFSCDATERRRAALLSLMQRSSGVFYVPNVVPREIGHLSHEEYNSLIEEFYYRFVEPSATNLGVKTSLSSDQKSLGDWLSKDAITLLERFSKGANKLTGSAHPSDYQRWISFLVKAHMERSQLPAGDLRRWLVEDGSWPGDVADDLAIEYQFSRDVLEAYEEQNS